MPYETDKLKALLKKRVALVNEIGDMESRGRKLADKVPHLELNCDLDDSSALAEITQLKSLADFLPRRIEQRQLALTDFDGEIIKACHEFISKSAGPLLRDLLARAKAKVKAQIKDSFEDETDLENAISKSKLVAEVERIQSFVTIKHDQQDSVNVYAAVLMKAWQDTEAVAAKLK